MVNKNESNDSIKGKKQISVRAKDGSQMLSGKPSIAGAHQMSQGQGLRQTVRQLSNGIAVPGTDKIKKNTRKLNSGVPNKILIGRGG